MAYSSSYYTRNGYDVLIYVGGQRIAANKLTGKVTVTRTCGENSIARFTIIEASNIQQYESYQGRPVYINIVKNDTVYRIFTGYVDLPSFDISETGVKWVTFTCTDRRSNSINRLSENVIKSIGHYAEDVFGVSKDQNDELSKRMQTITSDFDFDNYGNWHVTSWTPKATPDFTLTGSDIYTQEPRVSFTNRSSTINVVNINVKYAYQRLHQQICNVSWAGYEEFLEDWHNVGRPSFPSKEMIENASRTGNWKAVGSGVSFTNLWPAGGFGSVVWQPNQVEHEYKKRTTLFTLNIPGAGNVTFESPVLDARGNEIYDVIRTIITDTSSHLCREAHWSAALKFSQNVIEEYNFQIKAPQAIATYGSIATEEQYDVNDQVDVSKWEDMESGVYNVDYNFFINRKDNYIRLQDTLRTVLLKARTSILDNYRDVEVDFTRDLWPHIDLHYTVETTASRLSCKAKVYSYTHDIDVSDGIATTSVTLKMSRMSGTTSDSEFRFLTPPIEDPLYIGTPKDINLGTHIGQDPNPEVTPNAEKWNGFIGNKTISETQQGNNAVTYRTNFTEAFIVDYPAIDEDLRNDRYISQEDYVFNISIPNDDLEY